MLQGALASTRQQLDAEQQVHISLQEQLAAAQQRQEAAQQSLQQERALTAQQATEVLHKTLSINNETEDAFLKQVSGTLAASHAL